MTKHFTPPQRLIPIARPGELFKQARRGRADRPAEKRDTPADLTHAQCIRALPCLRCGVEPCEAAHVKRGLGHYRPDHRMIPLCAGCHRLDPDAQHKVGEEAFWSALGIDPVRVAKRLFEASGDVVKMRMIVVQAIAERG